MAIILDNSTDTITATNVNSSGTTASAQTTITANSASPALTVTQTGAGHALLVEDSSNPDSTPFVVDSSGIVLRGLTTARLSTINGFSAALQIEGISTNERVISTIGVGSDGILVLGRHAGSAAGDNTLVTNGNTLGTLNFSGADGTSLRRAATIFGYVDGVAASNDMPGGLVLSTTPAGSVTPVERMRIDSVGRIGFGGAVGAGENIRLITNVTGSTQTRAIVSRGVVQSDVTLNHWNYFSFATTQAAAFTLTDYIHFHSSQGTIGAGSAITNQYGFAVQNTLTGATNNYGFYGNIPAAANRWNFFGNGTAQNAFAGNTRIGSTVAPTETLDVTGTAMITASSSSPALMITQTGAGHALLVEDQASDTTPFAIDTNGRIRKGATGNIAFKTAANSTYSVIGQTNVDFSAGDSSLLLANFSPAGVNFGATLCLARAGGAAINDFTVVTSGLLLGNLSFNGADGSVFTEAAVISAFVDGTPGINDMPGRLVFSTTPAGSATPVERMRIDNAGGIGIGGAAGAGETVRVVRNMTGSTSANGIINRGTILSDVTTAASIYSAFPGTQAASFTLSTLTYYATAQNVFGAGSTVTNQYGFHAAASLIGATNNYGFRGALPAAANRWNFFADGTAPNYFAGDVRTETALMFAAIPVNSNTTVTATAASLIDGVRTGTPAAAIDLQVPTGTDMDTAFTSLQTNMAFEWSVINLAGATHAITVTTNTAHTLVGNMVVAANTSGRFLTRKTATNTFITYRIA